jgi:hypothetical protein
MTVPLARRACGRATDACASANDGMFARAAELRPAAKGDATGDATEDATNSWPGPSAGQEAWSSTTSMAMEAHSQRRWGW